MVKVISAKQDYTLTKADCLGAGIFEGEDPGKLPEKLPSGFVARLRSLISRKLFTGKLKEMRSFTLEDGTTIVVVGLGKKKEYSMERMRKATAVLTRFAESLKAASLAYNLHQDRVGKFSVSDRARECVVASILSLYRFDQYKTEGKEEQNIKELILFRQKEGDKKSLERGSSVGVTIAHAVNRARDLGNIPANILTPAYFEKYAKGIAKENKLPITVMDDKALAKKGMNLILAVGGASKNKPRIIRIEYKPSKMTKRTKKIALVGKGITFDTGGLNIKPGNWMDYMKSDMCGAADVLEVLDAAKKLGSPHHIIGIMPLAENSISGMSMRPGDVFKGYGGKTVEIMNTDAEGRLVLADAVAWAEDLNPDLIIDIATLTGSSIGHLGYEGSPVVGTDEKGLKILEAAGLYTYERIWKMPIWEEFEELIKSDIADLRNLSKPTGREAGVITGGLFMKQFIKKTPWIHIDIGNMSWFPEQKDYFPKHATGFGVRLLLKFLEEYK